MLTKSQFGNIEFKSEYVPSVTDYENKTTTLKSKREIVSTPTQLNAIIEKLLLIRNEITQ